MARVGNENARDRETHSPKVCVLWSWEEEEGLGALDGPVNG